MSYGKNREIVYDRHTTAKQPAEATEESQKSEQSGTTDNSRMNSSTSSSEKKSVSASSSDIETEPKGKRNGTATPQGGLDEGKVNTLSTEKQTESAESSESSEAYTITPTKYEGKVNTS